MITLCLSRHSLDRFRTGGKHREPGAPKQDDHPLSEMEAENVTKTSTNLLLHLMEAREVQLPDSVEWHKIRKHGAKATRYYYFKGLLFVVVRQQKEDVVVTVALIPENRRETFIPAAAAVDGSSYLSMVDRIVMPYRLSKRAGDRHGDFMVEGMSEPIPMEFEGNR